MRPLIAFDLEGPLSPMDHAFEAMALIEGGHQVFSVLSRYDDLLTLEGREGYEPGDTLSLVVPFLLYHRLTEGDLARVSQGAGLVAGARELVAGLKDEGWLVHIISTSYRQHAHGIARRLEVPIKSGEHLMVYCTELPLDSYYQGLGQEDFSLVERVEREIREDLYIEDLESGEKDVEIRECLHEFYWEQLQGTPLGDIFTSLKVMGGRRKVRAVETILRRNQAYLEDIAVVGDSITDFQMLKGVEAGGGLAVVFNGNMYALPHGTCALASLDLRALRPLLDNWRQGGREKVRQEVLARGNEKDPEGPCYDWLVGRDPDTLPEILARHKNIRTLVRGRAARLG